jgi:HK97 gp10 family phage protein
MGIARRVPRKGEIFTVDLQGFLEFEDFLTQLPKATAKTVVRNSLKKAAKPIRDAAEAAAPRGPTGNLANSFIISTKRKGRAKYKVRGGGMEVFVGSTARHAHLVEFGTKGERVGKSGRASGRMPENRFFTRVWDQNWKQSRDIAYTEMWKELSKAAKRLANKAEKGKLGKAAVRALS